MNINSWMLSRVSYAVKTCDDAMAKYDFTTATTACYNLWLYDLCDVYLVRKLTYDSNRNIDIIINSCKLLLRSI